MAIGLTDEDKEKISLFKKFFVKAEGHLHKDGTSIIAILGLHYDSPIEKEVLLKYLALEHYLGKDLNKKEKEVLSFSPWFPELKIDLKYPTVFDVSTFIQSPNSEWKVFLRKDRDSFLVYNQDNYITELKLHFKVSSYTLWKDYLVLLDESGILRVIYLFSLKEVFSRSGEGFKEVFSDKERLYLRYEDDMVQAFTVDEAGIKFGERVTNSPKFIHPEPLLREIEVTENENEIRGLAFSPDGKYLAVSVVKENKVFVFDTPTLKVVFKKQFNNYPNQVSFSPDGQYMAVGSGNGYVRIYKYYMEVKYFRTSYYDWVGPVVFSPKGTYLAFGGGDNLIRVYNARWWDKFYESGVEGGIYDLSFSPDERMLAVGDSTGKVTVFYKVEGSEEFSKLFEFDDYGPGWYTLSFSPDGRFLAYASLEDKVKVLSFEREPMEICKVAGFKLAFSAVNRSLITALGDTVYVWNTQTFEKKFSFVPRKGKDIVSIATSPDGKYLACGYLDGHFVILRADQLELLGKRAHELIGLLWMSPYLFVLDENLELHVWERKGETFIYIGFVCKVEEISESFEGLSHFNGWRIGDTFVLISIDNQTVSGSKDFQKHINVLLGGSVYKFNDFKDKITKDTLEVLR